MKYSPNSKESSWELSRRQQRKKIIGFIIFALPVIALAVILVINNRELITGENSVENSAGVSDTSVNGVDSNLAETPVTIDSENSPEPQTPRKNENDSDTTIVHRKNNMKPHLSALRRNAESDTSERKLPRNIAMKQPEAVRNDDDREYSIEMPPFRCSIENRKDIVISLSLELFYRDSTFRSALLFHRNEIKVMVMRTVKNKVLAEIKIGVLEKELLKEINSVLKNRPVTGVKIRNIQIEKVSEK